MKPRFLRRMIAGGLGALALAVAAASPGAADEFPTKPLRIIVPSTPGGSLDVATRIYAQQMGEYLGQSVLVENRAGGETLIGTRYVKEAAPDGYTLLAQATGFTLFPLINPNAEYDPLEDFVGFGMMSRAPLVVIVSAETPVHTIDDLIASGREENLTFASNGVGTPSYLASASFGHATGMNLTNVPYQGASGAMPDVAAGRVDLMITGYPSALPFISGGTVRTLAVTSDDRISALPDVPTVLEQGVDYTNSLWLSLHAPSGTPEEVLQRLSDAVRHASESAEVRALFEPQGANVTFMSTSEIDEFLTRDAAEMALLVELLGL